MTAAAKIRWLLALICLGLFLTAIIAKQTYSPENNLESSAKTLEGNLNQKEDIVSGILNSNTTFFKIKNVNNDEQFALSLIELAQTQKIYVATFQDNNLSYWSDVRVLPDHISTIKNGTSFFRERNGYYEAIRKTEGTFSVVFFIPVKNDYQFQNPYLKNVFNPELLTDNNIDIADFTDKNIYAIHTSDHHYLFSVKLRANVLNNLFQNVQILLWLSGMLLLCVLIHNLADYFKKKGYIGLSFFIVGGAILVIRFISLYYHWPDIYSNLRLFNPYYYHAGWLLPNQGDLVINMLMISWFALYIYNCRHHILPRPGINKTTGYMICGLCTLFLVILSKMLLFLASVEVLDSKISFDINNVLNLGFLSLVGLFILCLGFFIFLLFAQTCLTISKNIDIDVRKKLLVFFSIIIVATAWDVFNKDYSCFFLLWSLIIIILGYAVYYDKEKFDPLVYIGIIIVCSCISSIKLYTFQSEKEIKTRQQIAKQLEAADDLNAEKQFREIEHQLIHDSFLSKFFSTPAGNYHLLANRFKKLYFDGYLSKYDFTTYEYNAADQPLSGSNAYVLNDFKSMVLYSATKINDTHFFYKATDSFGTQRYFAIIPMNAKNESIGTLVVDLQSKQLKTAEPFPELLIEGNSDENSSLKNYSYAFYRDGKLLNQSGKYIYSLVNYVFEGKLKQFKYQTTNENGTNNNQLTYSHQVYEPSERKLIVVSKEENRLFSGITSLAFFFLVFMLFTLVIIGINYSWKIVKDINTLRGLQWSFWNNIDKVLYKTRIQVSMVFAVVVTLIIIGILTFYSVKNQYLNQQDDAIRDKITRIAAAFEKTGLDKDHYAPNDENILGFNSFADTYSSDLTLFDPDGKEIMSTQPKLYDAGLIEDRMNASAFIYLSRLKKSGFINPERIGLLSYKAAYAPVRNAKNIITGYLQLPYFSNETEYKEHIGAFLNTMINVYALVFVTIGLLAIGIARQITTPLTLIQQSLSQTIYGRKNEPIQWQHNDEIGSLIKEYNNMIAALEDSASKLAQSERENAWREMAKQVAHEIKNPLTPLKLGLQLLEKAWKDKDPKFDQKFERFSKSFVEQIDSLSRIASEFSNFAKMPETTIERVNIFDTISQAVNIFKQTDNLDINYPASDIPFYILADKDQILRCFNNLLKNAIEAMPGDRKGLVDITYAVSPGQVRIWVNDNGNGIPEALRERIFAPNFTTKSSGTGLGLALVKNAIAYAGGNISFETEMGKGSTFLLSFPEAK